MKKTYCLLLAFILSVVSVSGCSRSKSDAPKYDPDNYMTLNPMEETKADTDNSDESDSEQEQDDNKSSSKKKNNSKKKKSSTTSNYAYTNTDLGIGFDLPDSYWLLPKNTVKDSLKDGFAGTDMNLSYTAEMGVMNNTLNLVSLLFTVNDVSKTEYEAFIDIMNRVAEQLSSESNRPINSTTRTIAGKKFTCIYFYEINAGTLDLIEFAMCYINGTATFILSDSGSCSINQIKRVYTYYKEI